MGDEKAALERVLRSLELPALLAVARAHRIDVRGLPQREARERLLEADLELSAVLTSLTAPQMRKALRAMTREEP